MARANDTALRIMLDPQLKGLRELKSGLVKTVAGATEVFSKKMAKATQDRLQAQFKAAEKANLKAAAVAHTLATKNLTAETRLRLEASLRQHRKDAEAATKQFKADMKAEKEKVKLRQKALSRVTESQGVTRAAGEAGEKFGAEIRDAFDDMVSKDIPKMFKGVLGRLGSLTQKAGEGLMKKAPTGSVMAGLGSVLAKIGPALIGIAAIAAGFAAVLKIIVDVDAQAKEFNRTIITSGIAAASLSNEFGSISEALTEIRKVTAEFGFNRVWGTTASDLQQILGAYETAGMTFKELKEHVHGVREETEKLKDALSITMTYAKLFNLESSSMAENAATYMEELGMGFEGVQRALSGVYRAAKDSGFGVKRFYGMLLQATSGMTMYNVRLNEAAGLLVSLGKILGTQMGGDFLQQLTKGFGDKSMADKYKQVMMTGGGQMQGIFSRSASSTAADFQGKMKDLGAGATQTALDDTFKKYLGNSALAMAPGQLASALGSLSPEKQANMLADARLSGNDDLVRQLTNLMQVSVGAKGGIGNMARSLGGLDMGGKLAAMLSQTHGVMSTPLSQMNNQQIMAFESMTGIQGEQLEQLRRIDETMLGNWKSLTDMKKAMPTGGFSEDEIRRQITAYGAYVKMDEKGVAKVVSASIDKDTGTITEGQGLSGVQDYIQGSGDVFKQAAKDQLSADTRLAQEIAANTTELTKVMEQGVQWWLEKIHSVVESIWNFMGGGSEKAAREQVLQAMTVELRKYQSEVQDFNKKVATLKSDMATETPEGRAAAKAKIDALEDEITKRRQAMDVVASEKSRLLGTPVGEKGRTAREIRDSIRDPDIQGKIAAIASNTASASSQQRMQDRFIEEAVQRLKDTNPKMSKFEEAAVRSAARRASEGVVGARLAGVSPTVGGRGYQSISDLLSNSDQANTYQSDTGEKVIFSEDMLKAINSAAERFPIDDLVDAGKKELEQQKRNEEKLLASSQNQRALKKSFLDALKAHQEGQLAQEMMSIMAAAGMRMSSEQAKSMLAEIGAGRTPEALMGNLGKTVSLPGGRMGTVEQALQEKGIPVYSKANDLVMQIGRNGVKFAQRVDQNDVGVFSKPGGALSNAKGGGGVNVFHLYGEGPGVLNTITKAQSAGLL